MNARPTALDRRTAVPAAVAAAVAAVYGFEVVLARRIASFDGADALAAAIVIDLVLVVPLAVAWIVGRRDRRRGWIAVPLAVVGAIVAEAALPASHAGAARAAGWLAVPAELALIAVVVVSATRALRRARRESAAGADFVDALRAAASRVLPGARAPAIVAYEAAVLAFACGLAPRHRASPGTSTFTHHRRAAYPAIVGAVAVAGLLEIVGVHVLLARFSVAAAWVVTGLSAYGGVWILADLRAMSRRPTVVDASGIRFRLGLRFALDVPWEAIARIERTPGAEPDPREGARPLRLVALGAPTHRITLREPRIARGPYAVRRTVEAVEVAVDDVERFDAVVAAALDARAR